MKLVFKICLTLTEDCELTEKEVELSFLPINIKVFKREQLKKCLFSYSATTFFFTDIHRIVNFGRICLLLNSSRFWGNFNVIFQFPESKNIPREIFQTRGYFKQKLCKKNVAFGHPSLSSSIFHF